MQTIRLTAHSGCLDTPPNSLAYLEAALGSPATLVEVDVRLGPRGDLVLSHDPVTDPGSGPGPLALAEAWDLVVARGRGLNLDVKQREALGPLGRFLAARGAPGGTLVTGCGRDWVLAWRDLGSGVPVLYNVLTGPGPGDDPLAWEVRTVAEAVTCGASGLNVDHRVATEGLVLLAREAGLPVDLWTVNDPGDLRRWMALGVGLTTDRPDLAHQLLTQF